MGRLPRLAPLAALLSAVLLSGPAVAQAPAGRLAEATGTVTARTPGGGWSMLPRGAGLVEGQTLRTGPRTQAELDLGPNRLGLDPDTVLRVVSAHPSAPAFTLEQGRVTVLLRSLRPGQVGRLDLARGSVTFAEPGLYVVAASDGVRSASVGVSRGLVQVYGAGVSLAVPPGQTGVFGGVEPAGLRPGVADGFLADDPFPPPPQVMRPEMAPPSPMGPPDLDELPGAEILAQEGRWVATPEYGTVWYPPVAPGWSPYGDPWSGERWGYAPWNYGAWIMVGPRWAWLPPPHRRYVPPPAYYRAYPPPALAQSHRGPPGFGHAPGGRLPPVMVPPFGAPPPGAPYPGPRQHGGPPLGSFPPGAVPGGFRPPLAQQGPAPVPAPPVTRPSYAAPAFAAPGGYAPPRGPAPRPPAPATFAAPSAPPRHAAPPQFAAPHSPPSMQQRPSGPPHRSCPPGRPRC